MSYDVSTIKLKVLIVRFFLIQRGGGNGPKIPRQPLVYEQGANSNKFHDLDRWEESL